MIFAFRDDLIPHETSAFSILAKKGGENMSTYTENYNLIKPDGEDRYDVEDFNENMDTIDAQMMETEQEMERISEKIGTPSTEGDTLFSLLSGGGSVIKSIQRVTTTISVTNVSQRLPINTIDVSRSFVVSEHMCNFQQKYTWNYTLEANCLEVTTISSYDYELVLGFWIIEFN